MDNTERFLPIGSIVLLDGGEKKVMVTGFCSSAIDDPKKVYDYTGCTYPEGYLDFEQICLFDHSQISEIYFVGYRNEEEEEFKNKLEELLENAEQSNDSDDADKKILPSLDESADADDLEYL